MKDRNEAILAGEILYLYRPLPNRLILRLKANKKNHPSIFICGPLAEHIFENYKILDHIALKCNLQSSNKDGKHVITIFGTEILSDCIDPQSAFKLHGTVVRIAKRDNDVMVLYVETRTRHKSVVPIVTYYPDNYINVGDHIKISGEIQTKRKAVNNTMVYYTNFVLKNYKKAA